METSGQGIGAVGRPATTVTGHNWAWSNSLRPGVENGLQFGLPWKNFPKI
jgi:hypothetical protein